MDSFYGENSYPPGLSNKPSMWSDSYLDMQPYSYPYTNICNKENIDDCVIHLNKHLQNMCIQTVNDISDITVPLVNISFDLLKRIQQDSKYREELESKTSRIITDYDRLQTSQLRLKDDIEKLEREIAIRQGKEKELAAKNRSLCSSIKTEKDEVKRLNSTINHKELQYRHDSKKNEREMNRLKEKLSQVLMEKSHKILGPEILNALPKSDSKRATWKTNSNHVEEFYSMMLRDYEKKLKNLHSENHDLENCIQKIVQTQESLVDQFKYKLNSTSDSVFNEDSGSDVEDMAGGKSSYDPSEGGCDNYLSFEKCQKLLRKFNRCCITLQKYLEINKEAEESIDKTSEAEHETKLNLLKKKIERYKELVAFQEETLQTFANQGPTENSSNSLLHETQLIQEYEQLEIKKKLFLEAKENFEKERLQHMTEAVQLAEEKKMFNQEKCERLKQQFLEWTPKKISGGESFNALTEIPPATSSGDSKPDFCFTPSRGSLFKNSTPSNEQPWCKNLASGDAGHVRKPQRNSLLDCSSVTSDNSPFSRVESQSTLNQGLLRRSDPVRTPPRHRPTSLSSSNSDSNHLPCSSTSAPSGLNSEHTAKDNPSIDIFESLNSDKVLSTKVFRNKFLQQRRQSDPVCSMSKTEASNMITPSLRSRGNLSSKTHFISLNSLDESLCLKDQLDPQFRPERNSLHNTNGPYDF